MEKVQLRHDVNYTLPTGDPEKEFVIINNVSISPELINLLDFVKNYNDRGIGDEKNMETQFLNLGIADFTNGFATLYTYLSESFIYMDHIPREQIVSLLEFVSRSHQNTEKLKAPHAAWLLNRK